MRDVLSSVYFGHNTPSPNKIWGIEPKRFWFRFSAVQYMLSHVLVMFNDVIIIIIFSRKTESGGW